MGEKTYCIPQKIVVEKASLTEAYEETAYVSIAVIDSGVNPGLYVLSNLVRHQLLDDIGDYDEELIIDIFNRKFDLDLNLSEMTWGEIESVNIR